MKIRLTTPALPDPDDLQLIDGRRPTRIFGYRNEDGSIAYIKARYKKAQGNKEYRPWTRSPSGQWQKGGTNNRLYNLHLITRHPDRPICVVEGEPAAEAGKSLLPTYVVTTAGGSSMVKSVEWEPVRGRDVLVFGQDDEAGRDYVRDVITACQECGARSVKVVDLAAVTVAHGKVLKPDWDLVELNDGGRDASWMEGVLNKPGTIQHASATTGPISRPSPLSEGRLIIPEGQRNITLTSMAGTMHNKGMDRAAIIAALQKQNELCDPPLPEQEIEGIVRSISNYDSKEVLPCTDTGNAQRFAREHLHQVRNAAGTWYVWDGKRWVRDADEVKVMLHAKSTAVAIAHEATDGTDSEIRKEIAKWSRYSQSRERLKAMLHLAVSVPGISLPTDHFDANPWLLNCGNGTVDLQTGELRAHVPENLQTHLVHAEYDPHAQSKDFDKLLQDILGGNEEEIDFLQRAMGSSITGNPQEEKFYFVYGPGASGKSTFMEAVKQTLGSYAKTVEFESLLAGLRPSGGPREDIARLAGCRLVVASEAERGNRLATARIKTLTGRDRVTARHLYKSSFEFVASFTMWLVSNDLPTFDYDDSGMERRLVLITFPHIVQEFNRDTELKSRLCNDPLNRAAILAWLIKGCMNWQQQKLTIPGSIQAATERCIKRTDPLHVFLKEKCHFGTGPKFTVLISDMRNAYEIWARNNDRTPVTPQKFNRRMESTGAQRDTRHIGRIWTGVRLQ